MKYFTADLHLDHSKVLLGPRGEHFPTIEEWQEHILDEINTRVRKNDHLYILGDFAFKNVHKWRQRIRTGQLWFIIGNHDPGLPTLQRAFGRDQVRQTMMIDIFKTPTWLSHYAHAYWPKSHHGAYHLYGHCHDQREETLDQWEPERRSMDVCPETAYRLMGEFTLFDAHDIEKLLGYRLGHDPVEFYQHRRGTYR